jgi:hypothetical protein
VPVGWSQRLPHLEPVSNLPRKSKRIIVNFDPVPDISNLGDTLDTRDHKLPFLE